MPSKTKRRYSKSGTRKQKCHDPATVHGLTHWCHEMFGKLGWIVLAKSKGGMNDKIISYKKSLQRLEDKITCKIKEVDNSDTQKDLMIMLDNVKILRRHAIKDLP